MVEVFEEMEGKLVSVSYMTENQQSLRPLIGFSLFENNIHTTSNTHFHTINPLCLPRQCKNSVETYRTRRNKLNRTRRYIDCTKVTFGYGG